MQKVGSRIIELIRGLSLYKIAIVILMLYVSLFISLALFRNPIRDENLYLRETMVMSESISQGEWFGNKAVGIHGFIFKLPVALVFTLTGPSVEVATIFNILLAFASAFLFYKILTTINGFKGWAIVGLLLFISGFEFVRNTPTYLRDIPVLFSFLLFLFYTLKNKNTWMSGLLLLLILDAKEHVFYMVLPGYLIWIVIDNYMRYRPLGILKLLLDISYDFLKALLPAVIYTFLMFATSIVPLNPFNASILMLNEQGSRWMARHLNLNYATSNLVLDESSKEIFQIPKIANEATTLSISLDYIVTIINIFLSYLGKLIYPRTFSYISVPLVIAIPSIFMSIKLFIESMKVYKDKWYLVMSGLIFWSYLFVYLVRASHGRYLLAITPLFVLFFIKFLRNGMEDRKFAIRVLVITAVMMFISILFELVYVEVKIVIHIVLISLLFLLFYFINIKRTKMSELVYLVFVLILAAVTTGTSLMFSYKLGQINDFLKWGRHRNIQYILKDIPNDEVLYINDIGWDVLPYIYRKDKSMRAEWKWELKDWVPKDSLIVDDTKYMTLSTYQPNYSRFKSFIKGYNIDRVVIVKSTLKGVDFKMEYAIKYLIKDKDFKYVEKLVLKNKEAYIFKRINY